MAKVPPRSFQLVPPLLYLAQMKRLRAREYRLAAELAPTAQRARSLRRAAFELEAAARELEWRTRKGF